MNTKFHSTALISSPILAIYSIYPIYIFNPLSPAMASIPFIALTLMIYFFWLINIFVFHRFNNKYRYVLSYLLTTTMHMVVYVAREDPPEIESYPGLVFYPILSILAVNTIILIIMNATISRQQRLLAESEVATLKVSNLEVQKQILMQQLQPHFLFNTLSVLKSMIRSNPDGAEQYTMRLSDFLRYSAKASNATLVSLQSELDFVRDYLELQQVRFGKSFSCTINVPEEALQMKLPVYALQILIENAFKHNYFTEKNPMQIQVLYTDKAITVSNNKVSLRATERSGLGLTNLRNRYKLMMGKEIEVEESDNAFAVTIFLQAS